MFCHFGKSFLYLFSDLLASFSHQLQVTYMQTNPKQDCIKCVFEMNFEYMTTLIKWIKGCDWIVSYSVQTLGGFKQHLVGAISYSAQCEPPTVKAFLQQQSQIQLLSILCETEKCREKKKCWRNNKERALVLCVGNEQNEYFLFAHVSQTA